jgi:hypothetical protein
VRRRQSRFNINWLRANQGSTAAALVKPTGLLPPATWICRLARRCDRVAPDIVNTTPTMVLIEHMETVSEGIVGIFNIS